MTSERNNPSEDKKEKKQKRLIIILIILLLIALLFCGTFVGYIVYNEIGKDDPGTGGTGVKLEIDQNTDEIKEPEPVEKKPNVLAPSWPTMTIPANTLTLTDVPFYNPKENEGLYYLTFEVRLLDNRGKVSEVLLTTGLIPAGHKVSSVTMNKELTSGTYEAMLHVQPYNVEDNSPTNNMNSKITLNVK